MKRCSGSLIIREVQINHSEPLPHTIKVAITKKGKGQQHWQDWRTGNLYPVGENVSWYISYGRPYGRSSEN